ncbi:uncharacterized protein LOC119428679 [Nematolebias whitei]|uniref:uncharacterized protein LOC119428679 n=1 Tax=Nematolebias whitei TaxID=451745 RepID=UPI001898A9A3|nr:uncharacterized protein LOC119428679 [Nematolebias whitei]
MFIVLLMPGPLLRQANVTRDLNCISQVTCTTTRVVLKDSCPVELIHHSCTCVAGAALCNHCVALLFQSAHYSELKLSVVPPVLSCPEGEQQWHKPRTLGIKPGPVDKMTVLSAKPKSGATTEGVRSTLYKGLSGDLPDLSVLRVSEVYEDFAAADAPMICSMGISHEFPLVDSALGKVQAGSPLSYQQPATAKRDMSFHAAPPRPSLPLKNYHLQPSKSMFVCSEPQQLHLKSMEVTWDMVNKLKTTHAYYWQVQGQMLITGMNWCDFVVSAEEDILIQRIYADTNVMDSIKHKVDRYFFYVYLQKCLN